MIPDTDLDFGWYEWLSIANRATFTRELNEFLEAWKATAELDHDPEVIAAIERNRKRFKETAL